MQEILNARIISLFLLSFCFPCTAVADTETVTVFNASFTPVATLSMPRRAVQPSEIAVLINDNDPQSVAVANYYQQKRGIPDQNMIHLNFDQNKLYPNFTLNNGIDPADFAALKAQVDASVGLNIQALVISWSRPFRIADFNYYPTNYSITSAFTFGIDPNYINVNSCGSMPMNPLYDSMSTKPYTDLKIRPTMMLAGTSVANVEAMIDKAVLAEKTLPTGNGWFVRTDDTARSNPRLYDFQTTAQAWNRPAALIMNFANRGSRGLTNTTNVLFYQTGAASVHNLATNTYVPGAVADHLTSAGGILFNGDQMSILRWLEAGAAASYGTVTEPCAHAEKFPRASVLVKHYFLGNSVVEAYLKSVQWPAQGVFVGDPLARPFGTKGTLVNGILTVTTTSLDPEVTYALYSATSSTGPFTQIATVSVPNYQRATITVPGMNAPFYKLEASTGLDTQPQSANSKYEPGAPPAPQSPPAPAAGASPVRTETVTHDAWRVTCRDTPEAKIKKVCLAILAMVAQQQNQRTNMGAWIIARNTDGALVSVVQTPQIDIGVLIGKGVELTIGNGKPHQINFLDCNPQRCEALMTMDETTVRESIAASNGSAVVKFWKTDGAEFTINIPSIKGIDQAIAAVRP
jgi:uncharacterized protein (TIGR03790 family)